MYLFICFEIKVFSYTSVRLRLAEDDVIHKSFVCRKEMLSKYFS